MKKFKTIKEWTTKAGFPAKMTINYMGTVNGYVGVPSTHAFAGLDYYVYSIPFEEWGEWTQESIDAQRYVNNLEVHGGLTYAKSNWPNEKDDVWVFGFDTCHSGDAYNVAAAIRHLSESDQDTDELLEQRGPHNFSEDIYRDEIYVEDQCENLAEQIKGYNNDISREK